NIHVDGLGNIDDYGPLRSDLTVGPYQIIAGEPVPRDEAISFGEVSGLMSVTGYNPQFVAQWGYGTRPSGNTGAAIALADVDNDGQNDILMGADSLIADYVPGWPISNSPDHTFASIPYLYDMVTADFDGDGQLDIAAIGDDDDVDNDVTMAIHKGNGDGTFAPYKRFTTRGSVSLNYLDVVATGDLNGDSHPDLVTVGEFDKYATVLLNALFADGFETGDRTRWSLSVPP
ncbi:MAG: VCBS repeat-containing protein, partial [Thermoanaerobaculia bacterium]